MIRLRARARKASRSDTSDPIAQFEPFAHHDLPDSAPLPAGADAAFDRIARLAQSTIGAQISMVTFVDTSGQVMPGAAGLPTGIERARQLPLAMSLCQNVVRTQHPIVIGDTLKDPRVASLDAVTVAGVRTYVGMPIHNTAGRVVGSLCVLDFESRDWTPKEVGVLSDLANACSTELRLREAAERDDLARRQAGVLLALSESLASATTMTAISERVRSLATVGLGASSGGIALLDLATSMLTYTDADHRLHPVAEAQFRSFSVNTDSAAAFVARTSTLLFFASRQALVDRFPTVAAAAGHAGEAFAFLPLRDGVACLGVLVLAWPTERRFSFDERELALAFANYAAQAVSRALLLAEREKAAWTLQQALLSPLPEHPAFTLRGNYRPAVLGAAVGGDWYQALIIRDGSLTVSVGDVAGHDIHAAAQMGQLCAMLRAFATDNPRPPSAILAVLDRAMAEIPVSKLVTAVLANLKPGAGGAMLTWSNAGHLPPLLLEPGRPARFLTGPIDRLLGVVPTAADDLACAQRADHRVQVVQGTRVLLFTDGLIERRGQCLDEGLASLAQVAEKSRHLDLPGLVEAIERAFVAETPEDDTALIGIEVRELTSNT